MAKKKVSRSVRGNKKVDDEVLKEIVTTVRHVADAVSDLQELRSKLTYRRLDNLNENNIKIALILISRCMEHGYESLKQCEGIRTELSRLGTTRSQQGRGGKKL